RRARSLIHAHKLINDMFRNICSFKKIIFSAWPIIPSASQSIICTTNFIKLCQKFTKMCV
ncbi:hypothetical protein L9F63_004194, partial [Diploptera punctata]